MEGKPQRTKRPYIRKVDKELWHYCVIIYISGKADRINRVWLMTVVCKLPQILRHLSHKRKKKR